VDVVSGTRARAEHSRRIASFPRRYSPERTPTKAEAKLLAEFTTKEESNNGGLLKELIDDDPRGIRVPVASERIRTYVVEPLTRSVGFGVPNAAALQLCASHAPLVEVGAGTGYWAARAPASPARRGSAGTARGAGCCARAASTSRPSTRSRRPRT
jgi:hypothetical protein